MRLAAGLVAIGVLGLPGVPGAQTDPAPSDHRALIGRYCVTCHNERLQTAGLNLDGLDVTQVGEHPEVWEKVVRKLRTGMMPPPTRPQPPAAERGALASWLETSLDDAASSNPNPGARTLSADSIALSIRTPFGTSWPSTSTPRRCFRPTRAGTASTT